MGKTSAVSTYSDFADICVRFYDLLIDPAQVAEFLLSISGEHTPKSGLFVGGFFLVARELQNRGISLQVTDYTEDMLEQGRSRLLPDTRLTQADLRDLPFEEEFDLIFVIGRVFTHMLSEEDCSAALNSIHSALRPGGLLILDNYESSKIQKTDYFNARISVEDPSIVIERDSTTHLVSDKPHIVDWRATYRVCENSEERIFEDSMSHRAFSRGEIQELFEEHGFDVLSQGDNFDETSFYTLARRRLE